MKQILIDTLLSLHETHPFTCPYINPLIFQGKNCSRVYDIDISYNPESLPVYSMDLFEVVNGLNKWVTDVIAIYENLPESNKALKADLEIDLMIDNIKELLEFSVDIDSQERDVNRVIERWDVAHRTYNELTQKITDKTREVEIAESMISGSISDNDLHTYRVSERDRSANELQTLEHELFILNREFSDEIVPIFEMETETYTQSLEALRTRNDTLREETNALLNCLIMNFKNELNIEQPNDYLNKKFGIKDSLSGIKTLNIGLLYNNTPFTDDDDSYDNEYGKTYFIKLADDLYSRNILTHTDKMDFKAKINPFMVLKDDYFIKYEIEKSESRTPEFQKKLLLDKLKEYGYQVVRFYETIDDYKSDKDNFKTIELKDWDNKVKQKKTIKPV